MWTWWLFAFLVAHSGIAEEICTQGVDRPGGDLPGMPFKLSHADPRLCYAACEDDEDCNAWAFVDCGKPEDPPLCWLKHLVMPPANNSCICSAPKTPLYEYPPIPTQLAQRPYRPLLLREIKPTGWVKSQLKIQAQGLSGYISKFWKPINDSWWIGGTDSTGEAFEGVPYWLNGLVPLAALLEDEALQGQVELYLNFILQHAKDGWLGPPSLDPWPRFPLLMAILQYQEQWPTRAIETSVLDFFAALSGVLEKSPLTSWASFRFHDLLDSIFRVLDAHPEWTDKQRKPLLSLAGMARAQGFNFHHFFASNAFPREECIGSPGQNMATHGVNVGQAIKSDALLWRLDPLSDVYEKNTALRLERIWKYHGQAQGMFSCSEHLAGLHPSQGTELCTVVETMYSLAHCFMTFGETRVVDRMEEIAFNALPATFLEGRMDAHQYLQQTAVSFAAPGILPNIYDSDGPDSNQYGLAPNFGCCTANFNQGWPKFVTHAVLHTYSEELQSNNGIAVVHYAPVSVSTDIWRGSVSVHITGEYPFANLVNITVDATAPALAIAFRIPFWSQKTRLETPDGLVELPPAGCMWTTASRATQGTFQLSLDLSVRVQMGVNQAVSIHRGPLVFALALPSKNTKLHEYGFGGIADWMVNATVPWNYALILDPDHPSSSITFTQKPVYDSPFAFDACAVRGHIKGKRLREWQIDPRTNALSIPPPSPVQSNEPTEDLILLPIGCTDVRVTQFPWMRM